MAEAIAQGTSPQNILMVSLDTPIYADTALDKFIQLFVLACDQETNGHRLIIFDDIQYLKNWQQHLKVLTDSYPQIRFVVSGSAGAALKQQSQESGAGRFTDFFLPPLNFKEFLTCISAPENIADDIDALNRLFVDYINFGGFPETVINPLIRENVSTFASKDIVEKVLNIDLLTLYGITDITELKRLFPVLAYNSGNEVNLDQISQSAQISKPTIKKYIEYLESAFLIFRLKRADDSLKKINAILAQFSFNKTNNESSAFAQWAEGHKNYEVDWITKATDGTLQAASEIKWSDRTPEHIDEIAGLVKLAQKHNINTVLCTSRTIKSRVQYQGINILFSPAALFCITLADTRTPPFSASDMRKNIQTVFNMQHLKP